MLLTRANSAKHLQTDAESPMLEAYGNLRINMKFAAVQEAKTITVTSARKQEGKTTIAFNLALSFAHAGKRVMLVEGDLRKPSLHVMLGKNNRIGLIDLLSNWDDAAHYIHENRNTDFENLYFIPSGSSALHPPELLASKHMDSLLDVLKRTHDVVIIDTPAAMEFIDAKIIAAKCDGVLIVVEHNKVKREIAKKLVDELASVKANVLGAVLNKAKRK